MSTNVKQMIRNYITDNLANKEIEFSDTESLYDNGVLDSLKILQLVMFLQNEFQVSLSPTEMQIEDFETIDSITELVSHLK